MGFSRWLRSNSEHYLLTDAQRRVADRYALNSPAKPKSLRDRFWLQIFVPIYRVLPWGVRKAVIQILPGSHRKKWPEPEKSREPAI